VATIAGCRALLDTWIAGKLPERVGTTIEHILFGPDWPGATAWKETWRTMTAQIFWALTMPSLTETISATRYRQSMCLH
jgi:hypothetical protein